MIPLFSSLSPCPTLEVSFPRQSLLLVCLTPSHLSTKYAPITLQTYTFWFATGENHFVSKLGSNSLKLIQFPFSFKMLGMNWWNFTSNVPSGYKSSVYLICWKDSLVFKLIKKTTFDCLSSWCFHSFSKSTNFQAFFFMIVILVFTWKWF